MDLSEKRRTCDICGKRVEPRKKLKHMVTDHKDVSLEIVKLKDKTTMRCRICGCYVHPKAAKYHQKCLLSAPGSEDHPSQLALPPEPAETDIQLTPESVVEALRWLVSDRDTAWRLAQDFQCQLDKANAAIDRLHKEASDLRLSPIAMKINTEILQQSKE